MGDPIRSLTDPRPDPPAGALRCEYCECSLAANGDVLRMSQRARELRTLEDRLAAESAAHVATKSEHAQALARIAELETALKAATSPADQPAGGRQWGMKG